MFTEQEYLEDHEQVLREMDESAQDLENAGHSITAMKFRMLRNCLADLTYVDYVAITELQERNENGQQSNDVQQSDNVRFAETSGAIPED